MKRFLICVLLVFGSVSTAVNAGPELRIGMMPAVNSIPLIVAESEGFFTAEGVSVELEMFRNQLYREAALQTGRIDGSVSDLINAINASIGGFAVRVTTVTDGLFALVAAPRATVRTIADWNADSTRSVSVGLLTDSIIFYSLERLLERLGADIRKISPVTTLQVPTRMEMVVAGRIDAAVLPEPMTQVAVSRGAHVIADTSVLAETPGVLVFTPRALAEKAEQLRAFHRAYNRAVDAINADPDRYREVIVARAEFPEIVRDTMIIPRFQQARLPTRAEYDDVAAWMIGKGLIRQAPPFSSIVAETVSW
ncbi:MAG: hypothetical protein EA426_13285 [Spirochaetaceae bacterium]|nr:MAG: hypothetical protein EA426_13285 [Spirochaetaceae bacterium]